VAPTPRRRRTRTDPGQQAAERRRQRLQPLLALLVAVVLVVAGVGWLLERIGGSVPRAMPPAEQCVVQVGGVTDSLTLEQASNAAIVVAEGIRRGLPARAASIALATAFQESNLRNIDYGDRDSVGLFQQRPSQGWGSVEQIMDPWYSSGKFYEHLVQVPGWQSGDINDVAQRVQRSGVPDGYRKHVEVSKAWASALTGHSPAAVTCVDRGRDAPRADKALELVQRGFGGSVKASLAQGRITLTSNDQTRLWSATQLVMMTTLESGVNGAVVAGRSISLSPTELASWETAPAGSATTRAVVTLRA